MPMSSRQGSISFFWGGGGGGGSFKYVWEGPLGAKILQRVHGEM